MTEKVVFFVIVDIWGLLECVMFRYMVKTFYGKSVFSMFSLFLFSKLMLIQSRSMKNFKSLFPKQKYFLKHQADLLFFYFFIIYIFSKFYSTIN